jgi:hypothetical protein
MSDEDSASRMQFEKTTDPEALRAMLADDRVRLKQWRCEVGSKTRCRSILATLWSTPKGQVLQWAAPGPEIDRETRQAFIDAGIRTMTDGFVSYVQFVAALDLTSPVECSCDNHGRRQVEIRP